MALGHRKYSSSAAITATTTSTEDTVRSCTKAEVSSADSATSPVYPSFRPGAYAAGPPSARTSALTLSSNAIASRALVEKPPASISIRDSPSRRLENRSPARSVVGARAW